MDRRKRSRVNRKRKDMKAHEADRDYYFRDRKFDVDDYK